MIENRRILLRETPAGVPEPRHFQIETARIGQPGAGEVVLRNDFISLDPYMRGQIAGRHLSGRINPGDIMRAETVATILESNSANFTSGERVTCFGNWQEYCIRPAKELRRVRQDIEPVSYALSVLGMPGLTAYAGLIWEAGIKAGDTVLIPAAIGAVGATAAQLAKQTGCRIIGISSFPNKLEYAKQVLGYDACINRLHANVESELRELAPDGVDVYFDLVGGEVLDIASRNLKIGARVILCGLMADYNNEEKTPGPYPGAWISARANIKGLVVYDYEERRDEFLDAVVPRVQSGDMRMLEDISEGIDSAPDAFCRLMRGENEGKALVRLS